MAYEVLGPDLPPSPTAYAIVGADGHCEGVLRVDGAGVPSVPAGHAAVALSHDEAIVCAALGHHALRHDGRWVALPASHGRKLDRARGVRADHAHRWSLTKAATAADLGVAAETCEALLDGDPRLPVPGPAPWPGLARSFAPGDRLVIRPPDLVVRHLTEADVTPLSELMDRSGAYEGWTRQECWVQAHVWWHDPTVWALVLDWQGRALQYEMLHFDSLRTQGRFGFLAHVTRERPAWFWRECAKPIFQALLARGITTMSTSVRPDRKDFAESLVETYGAELLGLQNGYWALRYDVATMLAQATGWRQPETALDRLGTTWTRGEGELELREGTEADLPAALERMATAWHGRPRGEYAARMVRERLALDAGTLLLGSVRGELRTVWVMRWRAPGVVSLGRGTPWDASPEDGGLERLVALWCQQAGFETISAVFPLANTQHVGYPTRQARLGLREVRRVTSDGGTLVETEAVVADLLARPLSAWEATT